MAGFTGFGGLTAVQKIVDRIRAAARRNAARAAATDTRHPVSELGDFPFAVRTGDRESRQLVWMRNHASYMTRNGLLDYLRAIGAALRGLALNALIIAPYLILFALGVAAVSISDWGFGAAMILGLVAAAWILLSPIATRIAHVGRVQRTVTTGSTSSIQVRDRFEGALGLIFLLIGAAAVCEALSFFLDDFHFWTRERGFGASEIASGAGAAMGVIGAGVRLIPALDGLKRTIATAVVGIIGLITPLVWVLFLADYLVFVRPGEREIAWLHRIGWFLWWLMAIAVFIGLLRRAFSRRFTVLAIAGLIVSLSPLAIRVIDTEYFVFGEEELAAELSQLDFALGTNLLLFEETTGTSAERTNELRSVSDSMAGTGSPALYKLVNHLEAWWLEPAGESVPDEVTIIEDEVLGDAAAPEPEPPSPQSESIALLSASNEFFAAIDPSITDTNDYLNDAAAWFDDDRELEMHIDPFFSNHDGTISADEFFVTRCYFYAGSEDTVAQQLELFDESSLRLASAYDLLNQMWLEVDFGLFAGLEPSDYACLEADLVLLRHRLRYLAPLSEALEFEEGESELIVSALTSFDEPTLAAFFPVDETSQNRQLESLVYLDERLLDRFFPLDARTRERALADALFDETLLEDSESKMDPKMRSAAIALLPPLSYYLPLLSVYDRVAFDRLDDELFAVSKAIRELRIEAADEVVFSTRYNELRNSEGIQGVRWQAFRPSLLFGLMLSAIMWVYAWISIDPNRTSFQSLYRDRLATAFLVGPHPSNAEWVAPEPDIDLIDLSRYDVGSTAPYHLINCAVNLPASKDISIRDRQSDFFIFSKWFTGSRVTGYCRSDAMERVFPEMSVSTAMAISAAAAAPNMGRSTSRGVAAFMVLLNLRMGSWVPHPGQLDAAIALHHAKDRRAAGDEEEALAIEERLKHNRHGITVDEVMSFEKSDLQRRWQQLPAAIGTGRTVDAGLVGLAFSGGGIRSATLNLGLVQALHERGLFDHVDYLSTVSGGGYLGSAISVAMRAESPIRSAAVGVMQLDEPRADGKVAVTIVKAEPNRVVQKLQSIWLAIRGHQADAREESPHIKLAYPAGTKLAVTHDQPVVEGQLLVRSDPDPDPGDLRSAASSVHRPSDDDSWQGSFGHQFHWRPRPAALLREFTGFMHEKNRLVNVSDGGHIENLATIELLRRQCKYIIVGDAEMDPEHEFKGLTILLRTARVELGVEIEMNLDELRLDDEGFAKSHWAIGKIRYTDDTHGYLLYFKSSMTNNEPEDIRGYRARVPAFPHESTADQFFDEGQFESYRQLGYHMAQDALELMDSANVTASFEDLEEWFARLWGKHSRSRHTSVF